MTDALRHNTAQAYSLVLSQICQFRERYPEGRIAVQFVKVEEDFTVRARIYRSCEDAQENFLAEATALSSAANMQPAQRASEKEPQTLAVGMALLYAGFGLQGADASTQDSPSDVADAEQGKPSDVLPTTLQHVDESGLEAPVLEAVHSKENPLEAAMNYPCIIKTYAGKTLGELVQLDPNALVWTAKQKSRFPEAAAAAELICQYAFSNA